MMGEEKGMDNTALQNRENEQISIVKNHIYSLLKENRIRIGDRLPSEKTLSDQLNVSKSAVRDGLQSLKAVGLLSSVRGSGYRLTPDFDYSLADLLQAMLVYSSSSRKDIQDVWEALEIKELDLLMRGGMTEEMQRELEAAVRILLSFQGKVLNTEEDTKELAEADHLFHRSLAYGSGNLFIRAFYIALNEYRIGNKKEVEEAVGTRVSDELMAVHSRILQAIREDNLEKGEAAVREHYALYEQVKGSQEEDPLLQGAIVELQKKGFSRQQIMEKLMELE